MVEDNLNHTQADMLFWCPTLPKLSATQHDPLERPISTEEVILAIKSLKLSKQLRPDKLIAMPYK